MTGVRIGARSLLLAAALGQLIGCAGVRPWQREVLAKRCMQPDADPHAAALEQHVFEYREGASGGYQGSGGSGCGCN